MTEITVRNGTAAPRTAAFLLNEAGVFIDYPCGGGGKCGKCKVFVNGEPKLACIETIRSGEEAEIGFERRGIDEILTDGWINDFKPTAKGRYGVALDIGTTTVAAYLYDLSSGERLGVTSAQNPQTAYGADVITRLGKSLGGEGERLAAVIRDCVNDLISGLCKNSDISPLSIDSVTVAANTAMLYLLCGKNPSSITAAPFNADCLFGITLPADELGLNISPNAEVYLLPSVSAYVGGDITAAITAGGLNKTAKTAVLCDLGTNGEIALKRGDRLLCCSAAAGPAFEGVGIERGMLAAAGAVTAVDYIDGKFTVKVIGGAPADAKGICGSGIISAVSALLEAGLIGESGVFANGGAFLLPGTGVTVTQKDIRAVQLAKSAIYAGIMTLLKTAGIDSSDADELLIAGGFGNAVDILSAERIGLIPKGLGGKARAIGNASGLGAAIALLNPETRREMELTAAKAETVDLASNPYFMEQYVEGMLFLFG
jgi:uncharacterized 2Fe-2S/4Fe-4S cluster protein (DUF4445 family)